MSEFTHGLVSLAYCLSPQNFTRAGAYLFLFTAGHQPLRCAWTMVIFEEIFVEQMSDHSILTPSHPVSQGFIMLVRSESVQTAGDIHKDNSYDKFLKGDRKILFHLCFMQC